MNNPTNSDFTKLRKHIILDVPNYGIKEFPGYFYLGHKKNSSMKKSYFKWIKIKIGDWISGGLISETRKWHSELLNHLAILTQDIMFNDIKKIDKR